jgi:hypothetical protein
LTKRATTQTEGLFTRWKRSKGNAQDKTLDRVREIILRDARNDNVSLLALPERVTALAREIGCSKNNVVDAMRILEQKSEIAIEEKERFPTLATYCLSAHSNWFWASLIATIASVWLVFATSGFALDLRYFFGTLLIVLLPGYSIVELIYARRGDEEGEQSERNRANPKLAKTLVFSVALSLILVSLSGLILNYYTPLGIRLVPLTLTLSSVTVVCLFGALGRKFMQYRLQTYAIR